MDRFTLDTSGTVFVAFERQLGIDTDCPGDKTYTWSDLSPFEQGYTKRALEEAALVIVDSGSAESDDDCDERFAGFSDLAPETLAAIRKDCAAVAGLYVQDAQGGANCWRDRQAGAFRMHTTRTRFPPLTVSLALDGKVYLREQA